VVSFTPLPGKSPRYPFYRRLGGPQNRSGRYREVKFFYPTGTRTPARSQPLYRLSYPGSLSVEVLALMSEAEIHTRTKPEAKLVFYIPNIYVFREQLNGSKQTLMQSRRANAGKASYIKRESPYGDSVFCRTMGIEPSNFPLTTHRSLSPLATNHPSSHIILKTLYNINTNLRQNSDPP
jgi:hypothetical protein